MMIDGKYQTKIERWGLSQYGWRDSYGFHYGTLDFDSLKHNLQNMKSKLEGYIQDIDLKPLTINKPTKSINVYNKNENNISNIVSNVNFNTVEEKIKECESLTEEETKEALKYLKELKEIYESKGNRKSKWEKAKKILIWLADKSVDIAIAFFPIITSILSQKVIVMFSLDNIISFASMNIQTIGIFIAIIGGIIVTKLLNLKIEKDSLEDKLSIINKQIEFDNKRIKKREKKITDNNRLDFINDVYDHIFDTDFKLEKYDNYGLSDDERKNICKEIIQEYKKANSVFEGLDYYTDDVENILSENKIYETDEFYWIYYDVGCNNAKTNSYGLFNLPNVNSYHITSKITSLQENLEERDLVKSFEELNELREWRLIERENTIIKIKAINSNLKFDFWTFGIVTLFGIIIPQIVISIHPVFINYKFLKYVFAVYSILSFIGSMFLMMIYIYRMYTKIKK